MDTIYAIKFRSSTGEYFTYIILFRTLEAAQQRLAVLKESCPRDFYDSHIVERYLQ